MLSEVKEADQQKGESGGRRLAREGDAPARCSHQEGKRNAAPRSIYRIYIMKERRVKRKGNTGEEKGGAEAIHRV